MRKNKLVTTSITAMLIVSLLCGCGGTKQNSKTDDSTVKGSEADLAYKASDKPLELSFFYAGLAGSPVFDDNYPVFKEAARLTNITLKGTVPKSVSDANQVLTTMMSSGKIDDIVTATQSDFNKYASQGAFVPLNDLIDKYAPNIKAFLDKNQELKKEITSADGKIYFLPRVERGDTAKGWYIRKDWLDKLNIKEPKTVDEFYNVMKAFKEKDPNGNNKADEVAYFDREGNLNSLYNLYGIRNSFSLDEKSGKIVYDRYSPEYKEAVKGVRKWYSEGLVDQEIFTRGGNAREQLLGDNIGGITHDWFTSTSLYNKKLTDKVPGINFVAFAPPADIEGNVWEDTSRMNNALFGWGISTANKHAEETMKYLDFWFTQSGEKLYNYGVEGLHYEMVDNKPKFTDKFLSSSKSMTVTWFEQGINLYIGAEQDFNAERQWMTPDALTSVDLYINNGYMKKSMPRFSFTDEEQKIISEKLTNVTSYISEQEQKWIFGSDNIDQTFDSYMKKCAVLGMDDILNVYNQAYQRYQNY